MDPSINFVEFLAHTHFTFLEGASSPEELFSTAASRGYRGLGIADQKGLYAIPRAHLASKSHDLPLFIGAEIPWDQSSLYLFALNKNGYGNLCELLSCIQQDLPWDLESFSPDCFAFVSSTSSPSLDILQSFFPKRLSLFFNFLFDGQDKKRIRHTECLIENTQIPCIASQKPLYHIRERKVLQDVLRSMKHLTPLSQAGLLLTPHSEYFLKPLPELKTLFGKHPEWLSNTHLIASEFSFSLDEIRYRYPSEWLPEGHTSQSYLRLLVEKGLRDRFKGSVSNQLIHQVEHELQLISELHYEDYFLTIWDIIQFAKKRQILFQGRGSAANSIVCYLLGITAIDPLRQNLLFERFLSKERHEPPDIDIDFEHERREEVIQFIYERYGRERAAITAEVICFRKKSALKEVGKALEIDPEQTSHPLFPHYLTLCQEIYGVPKHLGTHVGGFVLSQEKLNRLIPIEKAANEKRTIVQWDKNDLDELHFTRVDILGLGILTALRKCFDIIKEVYQVPLSLDSIPPEDPQVYEMISKADTLGLFQIESRAQMNMLPRLKPKTFFDLVVQIALVRPGPIQGEMVHPYLKRRQGLEPVEYPHPELEAILKKTYGVPLFQEQIMRIAMQVAGFSGGEADELRRAMGIWRRDGKQHLSRLGEKFKKGLIQKGISQGFSDRIFSQIEGFAEYGFPESHAASFALIAYASAYLKCYYPDAYLVALLNSQPMGFYQNHTLIYDAKRKGISTLPVDINISDWDNRLIDKNQVRLGLREIHGLSKKTGLAIETLKKEQLFLDFNDFIFRLKAALAPKPLTKRELFFLAASHAFDSLGFDRRNAFWEIQKLDLQDKLGLTYPEEKICLPQESLRETTSLDFEATGVCLGHHPMSLFESNKKRFSWLNSQELQKSQPKRKIKHAGMIVSRQMPPTANGVVFVTLEDEWGLSNLIFWKEEAQKFKDLIWNTSFLIVEGTLQKDSSSKVTHLIVHQASSLDLELAMS